MRASRENVFCFFFDLAANYLRQPAEELLFGEFSRVNEFVSSSMRQLLRKRCVPIRVWALRGRRDALRFITRVTFTAAVDPLWHPDSCFFSLLSDIKDRGEPGQVGVCGRAIHLKRHDCSVSAGAPPFISFFHPVCSALQRCAAPWAGRSHWHAGVVQSSEQSHTSPRH